MSHGPGAVPAGGAAGGVGVMPMQALEGVQLRTPPPSVSLDMTVQPHEPIPTIATSEICVQKYVVLIQEYPPYARNDELFVASSAVLSLQLSREQREREMIGDVTRASAIRR